MTELLISLQNALGFVVNITEEGTEREGRREEHQVMTVFPSPMTRLIKMHTTHPKSRTIDPGANPSCEDSEEGFKRLSSPLRAHGSYLREGQRMSLFLTKKD